MSGLDFLDFLNDPNEQDSQFQTEDSKSEFIDENSISHKSESETGLTENKNPIPLEEDIQFLLKNPQKLYYQHGRLKDNIKKLCSSLNSERPEEGAILKYSELFNPSGVALNGFTFREPKPKPLKKHPKLNGDSCETDQEKVFQTTELINEMSESKTLQSELMAHPMKETTLLKGEAEDAMQIEEEEKVKEKPLKKSPQFLEFDSIKYVDLEDQSMILEEPKDVPFSKNSGTSVKYVSNSKFWGEFENPKTELNNNSTNASKETTISEVPKSKSFHSLSIEMKNDELESSDWINSIILDESDITNKKVISNLPLHVILPLDDTKLFPGNVEDNLNSLTEIPYDTSHKIETPTVDSGEKGESIVENKLDPFNLSNDVYYKNEKSHAPKILTQTSISHSIPAFKLSLFKSHLNLENLENWHRPKSIFPNKERIRIHLQRDKKKEQGPNPVQPSIPQRTVEPMRHRSDLSAKDGRIVLMEYIEERPPLVMNPGMGTKVKTFYRKKTPSDNPTIEKEDGETVFLDPSKESPFFGDIESGVTLQGLDNNLYRAPVFSHKVPETDFLLIRQPGKKKMILREIPAVFTVGQIQPRVEVPAPRSKLATQLTKARIQGYIYRLIAKKSRVKVSDLLKLFPNQTETSLRKILRADFEKVDDDTYGVKDSSQLPNEEELRHLITPEMVTRLEAMAVGRHQLKQSGVHRLNNHDAFFLNALQEIKHQKGEDDPTYKGALELDEELQLTPWNLTSNFVSALQGKISLELSGLGDPSGGRAEAFSYLKEQSKLEKPEKSEKSKKDLHRLPSTSSDLRKLSLEAARQELLKLGVPDHEIKRLNRWERITRVKEKSTQIAESGGRSNEFARTRKMTTHDEKFLYKQRVQLIFNNQIKALSDPDPNLSDDEEDEFTKDASQALLAAVQTKSSQKRKTPEDDEDKALLEKIRQAKKAKISEASSQPTSTVSILEEDSSKKDQKKPKKPRKNAAPDNEEMKRERSKLKAKLRNLEKQKEKQEELKRLMATGQSPITRPNTVQCGACGMEGHIRTNKVCPLYGAPSSEKLIVINSKSTTTEEKTVADLVKVEGTILRFPKEVLQTPKESLTIKISNVNSPSISKKRSRESDDEVLPKSNRRRRGNPAIELNSIFEKAIIKAGELPNAALFKKKVTGVQNYYDIIKRPMFLQLMLSKAKEIKYRSKEELYEDMDLIVSNCELYNKNTMSEHLINLAINLRQSFQDDVEQYSTRISELESEIASSESTPSTNLLKVTSSENFYNLGSNDSNPINSPISEEEGEILS